MALKMPILSKLAALQCCSAIFLNTEPHINVCPRNVLVDEVIIDKLAAVVLYYLCTNVSTTNNHKM